MRWPTVQEVGMQLGRSGRRLTSIVLAVVMTLSLAGGLMCTWMHSTLFDSDALARRAVHALDSEAVRHQLAVQLTD